MSRIAGLLPRHAAIVNVYHGDHCYCHLYPSLPLYVFLDVAGCFAPANKNPVAASNLRTAEIRSANCGLE